ncbi:hypothetical protein CAUPRSCDRAFT_13060 [Caulochytrium protostelioides]|nr:hypothetical protein CAUPRSCDRAFT_13060 [Caulochytrium protostelioides]
MLDRADAEANRLRLSENRRINQEVTRRVSARYSQYLTQRQAQTEALQALEEEVRRQIADLQAKLRHVEGGPLLEGFVHELSARGFWRRHWFTIRGNRLFLTPEALIAQDVSPSATQRQHAVQRAIPLANTVVDMCQPEMCGVRHSFYMQASTGGEPRVFYAESSSEMQHIM